MKHLNCRFVRRQHVFILRAEDLNTLLLGIVAHSRTGIVDIKYGVYSISGTSIMVFVGACLNYVEADYVRCKLTQEKVKFEVEIK